MSSESVSPFPISKGKSWFLVMHYFLGYQFLYPLIFRDFTLRLNPDAKMIHPWFQMIIYCLMIGVSMTVAWPLLKESLQALQMNFKSILKTCFQMLVLFYLTNIVINVIILMFSSVDESANQAQVVQMMHLVPFVTLFSSLIYAPIVEEIVFRGVCYRALRPKLSVLSAALFSAFAFGFIHIMSSLLIGNFTDFIYILSYGCIGFFLALTYEKTNSIFGSMFLHFLNNAIACLLLIA